MKKHITTDRSTKGSFGDAIFDRDEDDVIAEAGPLDLYLWCRTHHGGMQGYPSKSNSYYVSRSTLEEAFVGPIDRDMARDIFTRMVATQEIGHS